MHSGPATRARLAAGAPERLRWRYACLCSFVCLFVLVCFCFSYFVSWHSFTVVLEFCWLLMTKSRNERIITVCCCTGEVGTKEFKCWKIHKDFEEIRCDTFGHSAAELTCAATAWHFIWTFSSLNYRTALRSVIVMIRTFTSHTERFESSIS